jgi:hypothetical protein
MAKGRVSRGRSGAGRNRRSTRSKRVADLQRPKLYKASSSRARPQTVRLVLEHTNAPQVATLPSGAMQTYNAIRKARM